MGTPEAPQPREKTDPYLETLQNNPLGFALRAQEVINERETSVLEIAGQLKAKANELGEMIIGLQPVTEHVLQGLCQIFNTDSIEFLPDEVVNSLLDEKLPLFNEMDGTIDIEVDEDTLKDSRKLKREALRFVDSVLLS